MVQTAIEVLQDNPLVLYYLLVALAEKPLSKKNKAHCAAIYHYVCCTYVSDLYSAISKFLPLYFD